MARIRTVKPEFPQSESMGRVSREARLCFILLWTILDDEGRARGSSRMLASLLYPYDDDAGRKIDGWLRELEKEGCIVRYTVDSDSYVASPNWLKHQKIDHPGKSRLPPPPENSRSLAKISESLAPDLVPSTLDLGPRTITPELPLGAKTDFEIWYGAFPRKVDRKEAERAYAKAIKKIEPPDLLAATMLFASACVFKEKKFIPHPATWLNKERWRPEETGPAPPDPKQVFTERVAAVMGPEARMHLRNFALTFGDDLQRAVERLEKFAAEKNPRTAANEWFFQHGAEGCSVGLMN